MSLLSSGLTGVAEEELEEVLGRSRSEEGSGGPLGGRESRVSLYEFSDPIFQVIATMLYTYMYSACFLMASVLTLIMQHFSHNCVCNLMLFCT